MTTDVGSDLVIGLGEIGRALREILSASYRTLSRDVEAVEIDGRINVLHICYPYEIQDFVGTTVEYIGQFSPELTIIHSTVVPGTTCMIFERTGTPVAYSPVRGKHVRMRSDLVRYTKSVAGATPASRTEAIKHLEGAGFKVRSFDSCKALELAKLIETTYFGLLVAWAQEVERFSREVGADYEEVVALTEDVEFLPPVVFVPGYIGGHCVIPNTYLLESVRTSQFVDAIRNSNQQKKEEWIGEGRDLTERISPKPVRIRGRLTEDPKSP